VGKPMKMRREQSIGSLSVPFCKPSRNRYIAAIFKHTQNQSTLS
jgi:hypothetical protein